MAQKKITDLQLIDSVTDGLSVPVDDGIQTYRSTAAQIKNHVLAAGNVGTSQLAASAVTTEKINDGAVTSVKADFTRPTIQRFTSGSGIYTTPSGVKWLRIRMVGGGGGGGGNGTSGAGNGTAGGDTTFGTLTAAGGGRGLLATSGTAGGADAGGSASGSPNVLGISGQRGQGGPIVTNASPSSNQCGGTGGSSFFGGAGAGVHATAGQAAAANTGSGGAGAGGNTSAYPAFGGSAGAYIEHIITSPSSTYSYGVGSGGSGGSAGTSGLAGGNGAAGLIIVEEHYQ